MNEQLLDWVELPDGRVEGLSYPPELDRLERQFTAHKPLANYDAIWRWRIAALRSWRDMRDKYEALRRKHKALVHGLKSLLSTPENKTPC